ncbi:hypothetical protein Tco_0525875 [Tanacetum coccineum]
MLSIPFVDEDDYIPLGNIIVRYSTSKAITPDFPIKEPDNSLSMGDEHLDTTSSNENLVPIPRIVFEADFDPMMTTSSDDVSFENIRIEPDQEGLISIDNSNNTLLELPEVGIHFICSVHFLDLLWNYRGLNEDQRGSEIIFLQNVEDDDSFTFVIQTFLPFLTYPEASPLSCSTGSEDTIFDPGIITFPFSYLEPVAFSMEVSCSKCCSP